MKHGVKALSTGTWQVFRVSLSPSVPILFLLAQGRVQTRSSLTLRDFMTKEKGPTRTLCTFDVCIGPDLNMKLTLSRFLYNTLKSKLKPRHGNDLRNGKRKKTKEPQQGKEKRKQVSITKVKVRIPYK